MKTMNQAEMNDTVQAVLDYAKKIGASDAEIDIILSQGLSVVVRQQTTEELIYHQDQAVNIHLFNGQQQGTASCTDLSIKSLKNTVEAAWAIAQHTGKDPHIGLADQNLMAKEFPDLGQYYSEDFSADQALEIAKNCEQAALSYSPLIKNSEGASLSTNTSYHTYANTHGFCHTEASSLYQLNCTVVAEQNRLMQRDFNYILDRKPEILKGKNPEITGKKAAERTVQRLGAKPIKTQKASVIFVPEMARSLLKHLTSAISGLAIYRRTSFLVDQMGKKIFPEKITIGEQPYLFGALGSQAFDSEGVTTKTQNFINQGYLEKYILGSYSARCLGLSTTGNADGVHNLTISCESDSLNLEQLLLKMGTGFLITELLGSGVNLLTGDYSRGAAGFWIENGKIIHPVEGVTVASNLKEMYQNILAVGNDIDTRGNIRTGSIWIESMMISGN
mgnify:CR=1 FL=1